MRFYFRCEAGHQIVSPRELTQCLGFVKGCPCRARLQRIGGPRKVKEAA